jgi:hypothetical protein
MAAARVVIRFMMALLSKLFGVCRVAIRERWDTIMNAAD